MCFDDARHFAFHFNVLVRCCSDSLSLVWFTLVLLSCVHSLLYCPLYSIYIDTTNHWYSHQYTNRHSPCLQSWYRIGTRAISFAFRTHTHTRVCYYWIGIVSTFHSRTLAKRIGISSHLKFLRHSFHFPYWNVLLFYLIWFDFLLGDGNLISIKDSVCLTLAAQKILIFLFVTDVSRVCRLLSTNSIFQLMECLYSIRTYHDLRIH